MATLSHPCCSSARSALAAVCFLAAAALVLALSTRNPPPIAAASNVTRSDLDQDGLTDLQEFVLGTLPDQPDTDTDGYSDLEEEARSSDPLDSVAIPVSQSFSLSSTASAELGIINFSSTVYVAGGDFTGVDLKVGIVIDGVAIEVSPSSVALTRGFIFRAHSTQDRIAMLEIAVPELLVQRFGQLDLYSIVRNSGAPSAVAVLSLVNMGGTIVSVEPVAQNFSQSGGNNDPPRGVIYRPVTSGDQIPTTWTSGEVCWQRTTAVGVNGVSIIHEIESADCVPMDTYCSGADCAASVGRPLSLPDPGALAGG